MAPGLESKNALLANIPDPVILVDGRGLVTEANGAARVLLPMLRTGQPLAYILRDPDILGGIGTVLRTGEAFLVGYHRRVPDERTFEVRIARLAAGQVAKGEEPGLMLFFRDLTQAKRLERMRVDFVANVSHELRTPLASLMGFIETLQGPARNDPAAQERFLGIMREQGLRMTRLIDDLLSLSRIELREHVPPSSPLDLVPLARHMVDTLSLLAGERGVALELRTGPEPLIVLGDRDELLRLLENLIENAVKYGGSGGKVEVSLGSLPDGEGRPPLIELSVCDHGPGIAADHLPRLTERFYRVDVAESRQKGGTGLGLAIVKHIVARHRGRLLIESEPGQGATFRVLLPEHAPG